MVRPAGFILLLLAFFQSVVYAAELPEELLSDLRAEVNHLRNAVSSAKRTEVAAETKNLTECGPYQPPDNFGSFIQYMYNGVYRWSLVRTDNGVCIYLFAPVNRPLSVEEGRDLVLASKMEFPVDDSTAPIIEPGLPTRPGSLREVTDPHDDDLIRSQIDNREPGDTRVPLTSGSPPFNAVAWYEDDEQMGSAVQLSPFVFMTAAHIPRDVQRGPVTIANAAAGPTLRRWAARP